MIWAWLLKYTFHLRQLIVEQAVALRHELGLLSGSAIIDWIGPWSDHNAEVVREILCMHAEFPLFIGWLLRWETGHDLGVNVVLADEDWLRRHRILLLLQVQRLGAHLSIAVILVHIGLQICTTQLLAILRVFSGLLLLIFRRFFYFHNINFNLFPSFSLYFTY